MIYLGTSGYSYETGGSGLPKELPPGNGWSTTASILRAVEINLTFYRLPASRFLGIGRAERQTIFVLC